MEKSEKTWRVDFFFKISKRDFTFIREMRVGLLSSNPVDVEFHSFCTI